MHPFYLITLEFGANGITSEVNEYQEYERLTEVEANEFFDGAIRDAAMMGITGARMEYFDEDGFAEVRVYGSYNV
jgi:hypothetical protein